MEKKDKKKATDERPQVLRLRRRPVAELSDDNLGEAAGGHHCRHTQEGYASCAQTCPLTCPPGHTCDHISCFESDCGVCQTDECFSFRGNDCG